MGAPADEILKGKRFSMMQPSYQGFQDEKRLGTSVPQTSRAYIEDASKSFKSFNLPYSTVRSIPASQHFAKRSEAFGAKKKSYNE